MPSPAAPRAIAFSAKQKRRQLLDKRAVKRGELDANDIRISTNPEGNYRPLAQHRHVHSGLSDGAARLTSRFTALDQDYIERSTELAHSVILPRPLPSSSAIFPRRWLERDQGTLTCPVRPAFESSQSKAEVEEAEEKMFADWLLSTTVSVEQSVHDKGDRDGHVEGRQDWQQRLRSPTWFETNLEVWRQLWRVTESAHVLLLLADARCPPVHLPTSLRTHVKGLTPQKEVIIVLTKSDLVHPAALSGWREWVKVWWTDAHAGSALSSEGHAAEDAVQVVTVQSYDDAVGSTRSKQRPDLPTDAKDQLVHALRAAHSRIIRRTSGAAGSSRVVRDHIDWETLPLDAVAAEESDENRSTVEDVSLPPLTIGLIGQPNVGKSSLLNAILGRTRVKASRTPGKTKHFQTLFWGPRKHIRFVDCPGLVCPSLVGLEVQALCGILPIAQIPSLPACVLLAAHFLPLETIFGLPPPALPEDPIDPYAGKRTWRTTPASASARQPIVDDAGSVSANVDWTAWNIMEGLATDKGYRTAKTGRPDTHRAATGIMLALAEGSIPWYFRPPGANTSTGERPNSSSRGADHCRLIENAYSPDAVDRAQGYI